jgi:hypothetical protein
VRVGLLVRVGIGHGQGRAIADEPRPALPEPGGGGPVFHLLGHVVAQALQEGFGELGAGLAVRPRFAGAGRQAQGRAQHQHAGHRRDARLLLADDLRQEGPPRDRYRVDVARGRAASDLLFRRDGLDARGRQALLERQARSAGEGVEGRLECGGRAAGWLSWHKEAFLDPCAERAKEGLTDRRILAGKQASDQQKKGTSGAEKRKIPGRDGVGGAR